MRFSDREDAGQQLAKKLARFRQAAGTVVLALPRGGVVPGKIVADALGLPLDIVVPRKIGAPGNDEYAVGAIAENGDAVWNEFERARIAPAYLDRKIAEQKKEAERRLRAYRQGRPRRDLKGKTVIVVDDGIATGLTMRAAISTARSEGAARVIVAVPFCPEDSVAELKRVSDEVITVFIPEPFAGAVGSYYDDFPQVEDDEVIQLMKTAI